MTQRDIAGPVAVDTETSGLYIDDGARVAVVSLSYRNSDDDQIVEVLPFDQGPVPDKPGVAASLFPPDYNLGRHEWERLLEDLSTARIVMHNAKFDLHMLRVGTRHWEGLDLQDRVVWDTLLANRVLDPEHLLGLKPTAERLEFGYGGNERDAEAKMRKAASKAARGMPEDKRYDLIEDWDLMREYAGLDAEFTLKLFEMQYERVEQGEGSRRLIDQELEVAKVLYRMETRGIQFDVHSAYQAVTWLEQRKAEVAKELPFVPTGPAAKRYWFEEHVRGTETRLMPYSVTPTGKPQLNKEVLARMVKHGVPYASEWAEYSKIDKMISMWYEGWANKCGVDGRLRTVFNQTKVQESPSDTGGAVSGRFSVERIQLQAIPHDYQLADGVPRVRSLVQAKAGHELWEVDLAQAEVRVASSITQCTPMIEGIKQGDDAHTIATKRVFGIDQSHPEWGFYRQVGKRLVFAMVYGAGVNTVREQIKVFTGRSVPHEQVQRWVTDFRNEFPQFPRYSRRISNVAERHRRIRLVSGMVRAFRPDEETHKAFNAEIQGGVAEVVKEWMVWVDQHYPGTMLVQVHDSLVLELPTDQAEGQVKMISEAAAAIFELRFPGVPFHADAKRWEDKD